MARTPKTPTTSAAYAEPSSDLTVQPCFRVGPHTFDTQAEATDFIARTAAQAQLQTFLDRLSSNVPEARRQQFKADAVATMQALNNLPASELVLIIAASATYVVAPQVVRRTRAKRVATLPAPTPAGEPTFPAAPPPTDPPVDVTVTTTAT